MRKEDEYREIIIDLCWQFGHIAIVNGKEVISTGGLSALEDAFRALGFTDPCPVTSFVPPPSPLPVSEKKKGSD